MEIETQFAGAQDIPALLVWERVGGLTEDDLAAVRGAVERVNAVEGIAGPASPLIPSEDGEAVQVVLPLPGDNTAFETLPGIVEDVTEAAQIDGPAELCHGTGRAVRRLRRGVRGHRHEPAVHDGRGGPDHLAADLPQRRCSSRC